MEYFDWEAEKLIFIIYINIQHLGCITGLGENGLKANEKHSLHRDFGERRALWDGKKYEQRVIRM